MVQQQPLRSNPRSVDSTPRDRPRRTTETQTHTAARRKLAAMVLRNLLPGADSSSPPDSPGTISSPPSSSSSSSNQANISPLLEQHLHMGAHRPMDSSQLMDNPLISSLGSSPAWAWEAAWAKSRSPYRPLTSSRHLLSRLSYTVLLLRSVSLLVHA
jgi:hypothetical protein